MNKTIKELLENKGGNYILPFFWQHGESEEVLREYMGVIEGAGIKAVCLEARPHPDFAGPGWWRDLDIILDEAKKRDMKVWILDDAHFPTGQAGGRMKDADTSLRKQYIMVQCADVSGPMPQVTFSIDEMFSTKPNPMAAMFENPFFSEKDRKWFDDDRLLAVVACRVVESEDVDASFLDLTVQVKNGMLEWDVPQGMWKLFVIYETRNGGGRTDYINMLDEESCRVQIDAVYEPHYEHYKEDFGKTIAGFFSDEPCLGNTIGFDFNESIGRRIMPLPWNKDMPHMMEERLGKDYIKKLVALWANTGSKDLTAKIRYAYMDAMTTLVGRNFSSQIGRWCEEHGVEYIGHIVEDSNQHSRMGSSQGHFFRSMKGQHMSGIDDIGGQVLPGGDHTMRHNFLGTASEGEFYHFELGKLGSSHAHIDPKKQGRAMCEIFGAYGWSAGVRLMKYLTDHFLVRGINYFVPHAFSPKAFPDPDCPPHFYAHGENPQYRHFGKLMGYMNRMCHIFNGGMHVAPVALLYHGEAEWTGNHMFDQKPAREMLEHQIDFDIIPPDVFTKIDEFKTFFDGKLHINGETYKAFVVPYAEFITKKTAEFAIKASKDGFPVIFVKDFPSGICDNENETASLLLINEIKTSGAVAVALKDLSEYLVIRNLHEVKAVPSFEKLRYYHYEKDDTAFYMFSNEDIGQTFQGTVTIAAKGKVTLYDGMSNNIYKLDYEESDVGTKINLELGPYESIVAVVDSHSEGISCKPKALGSKLVLGGSWKVSVAEAKEYPSFKEVGEMKELSNFGRILPDFSGFICYEQEFDYPLEVAGMEILHIQDAYEGVEVFLNGKNTGMAICPPFDFSTSGILRKGKNQIRIEVATTLYRKVQKTSQGGLSIAKSAPVEPTGIIGEVAVYKGI